MTRLRRWIAITATVVASVALGAGFPAGASAAGQLTLTATPRTSCGAGQWDPFGVVSTGPAPYFSFKCTSSAFYVDADVASPATAGQYVEAQITAPAGITITSATATGSVSYSNAGWYGGSYSSSGSAPWPNGSTTMTDPVIASTYWGYQVICVASSCTGAARIQLNSVTLTAIESQHPNLTAGGSDNLWFQTRPGEWIWNPPNDPWSLMLAASDQSGVCSMFATIGDLSLSGPSAAPDTATWHQCPDPSWTPSVDTNDDPTGPLPITVGAMNAAGLTTSFAEDVHVDNEPVDIALSTSNDASRTIWANHAVTVFANATAGPSGVGGANCSDGTSGPQPYTTRGVTVDGDGIHRVVCTAWNNAVGPQGQPNTTTSSTSVHIDEAPPSISFEPLDPRDPTDLVVDSSDTESGVANSSIEMAPAGTANWTALPAAANGPQIAARFDDGQRHGPYVFKATSCDNAGNCASTTQRLTLPVRAASDSEVSLTKIVNPIRRRVVVTRVLVGWHWATVRRGNQLVRVKRGGHFKTVKVIEYVEPCTTKRIKTGPHTWQVQRKCSPSKVQTTRTLRVGYGRPVTIHGLYMTVQGVPIGGQRVHILAAPDNGFQAFSEVASTTTASDGRWTATVSPGPSRLIRAVTDGTATILPSSGQVVAIVPAKIRLLKVWPRHVAWGATVHLVGQLFGGYLPAGGALVRLRIGYKSTYNTYGVQEHVMGDGRFETVATFGPGDPSISRTYWFQVASLPMGDYPFAPAASQRVAVTVGGHPGS